MIHTLLINQKGEMHANLTPEEVRKAVGDPEALIWISLEQPTSHEIDAVLRNGFHFHPLAIDDCLNSGYQTPKVDDFGSYIFIIAHAILFSTDIANIETHELNLFLGSNYLVTVYLNDAMPPVQNLWQALNKDERLTQNGSDFLCHRLLDFLVDDYLPVLDQLDEQIELIEDKVLTSPSTILLGKILDLKHTLMSLRRIISPQREVMNRLSRDGFHMIDEQSKIYFRDLYDHLVRFQDLVESLRDIVSGSMDIYLNSTSLRLNEVMKALTIVSTIFLPLSFVAGMFGMNFSYMIPDWDSPYGYLIFWIICLSIAIGMLVFFKKRRWF
jgi:magnesium transporter